MRGGSGGCPLTGTLNIFAIFNWKSAHMTGSLNESFFGQAPTVPLKSKESDPISVYISAISKNNKKGKCQPTIAERTRKSFESRANFKGGQSFRFMGKHTKKWGRGAKK